MDRWMQPGNSIQFWVDAAGQLNSMLWRPEKCTRGLHSELRFVKKGNQEAPDETFDGSANYISIVDFLHSV